MALLPKSVELEDWLLRSFHFCLPLSLARSAFFACRNFFSISNLEAIIYLHLRHVNKLFLMLLRQRLFLRHTKPP